MAKKPRLPSSKPAGASSRAAASRGPKRFVSPATNNEEQHLAQLRTSASDSAAILDVGYANPITALRLAVSGSVLMSGLWDVSVTLQGRNYRPDESWECMAWHSDADCDYLELQTMPSDEIRIERMILLARPAGLLFLADSVCCTSGSGFEYTTRIPFNDRLKLIPGTTSRDCRIDSGTRTAARLFPISVPCSTVTGFNGEISTDASGFSLRQAVTGRGRFFPFILDWSAARRRTPSEWTPLTVSEKLAVVPPDRAGGYRWKNGTLQWLMYHALTPTVEGRAVLGLHTRNETVIANFDKTGKVTPIIGIE